MNDGPLKQSYRSSDIKKCILGLHGKPFNGLVQYHLRTTGPNLETAVKSMIAALEPHEFSIVESMIDNLNIEAHDVRFWHRDCLTMYTAFEAMYSVPADASGHKIEIEDVFNVFQIVVLHFARECRDNKPLRIHAGVKKGWFS